MVKPLIFKGDKKPKKRKHPDSDPIRATDGVAATTTNPSANLNPTTTTSNPKKGKVDENNTNNNEDNDDDDDDDTWVDADAITDIAGPVVLVLPTEPPAALASDVNGSVFASQLENMVDGNARTVEPHDVRQVWVATRVAGTETWSLKGHHGKYLSADKVGLLSARREAISPEETHTFVPAPDDPGGFGLQTARETYVATESPPPSSLSTSTDHSNPTNTNTSTSTNTTITLRADAESLQFNSTLRIRMQARFKPRLRANKAEKARGKISRKELEALVGRRLEDEEVRRLKRARREGDFHERLLDAKVKGKHDRFA